MDDLIFGCKYCGQDISSPPDFCGRGVYCPSCGRWLMVPCDIASDRRVTVIHKIQGDEIVVSALWKGQQSGRHNLVEDGR